MIKRLFWKIFTAIDARLKFPNLRKGDVGIQCGFDMDSAVTSDLFLMHKRVGKEGRVFGIDPDPENHAIAKEIISAKKLSITTIESALADTPGETTLVLGRKRGWNQVTDIPLDSTVEFQEKKIIVPVKTLAQVIKENNIPYEKVRHINLTINGCEYHTLKGMKSMLKDAQNLSLTVIAGRYDETGTIHGERDVDLIVAMLNEAGFRTKFRRIHQLFWWGFVVKLLIQRRYVFNKKNYGVVFAAKGNCRIPWYQSFS